MDGAVPNTRFAEKRLITNAAGDSIDSSSSSSSSDDGYIGVKRSNSVHNYRGESRKSFWPEKGNSDGTIQSAYATFEELFEVFFTFFWLFI